MGCLSTSSHYVCLVYLLYACDLCYGAQSPEGVFLYPKDNTQPTFNYMDVINVTWDTYSEGISTPWLMLWLGSSQAPVNHTPGISTSVGLNYLTCEVPTNRETLSLVYNQSVSSLSSILMPLNYGQPYNSSFFRIQQGSASDPILSYSSTPFNIQKNEKVLPVTWNLAPTAASTSSTSSALATLTASTPAIPFSTSTAHSSTATTSVPSSQPTLTESSIIAVAICASLTLIALTALCGILIRQCYRAKRRPRPPVKKTMLVELVGDFKPAELEAGSVHSLRSVRLSDVRYDGDEKDIRIEVTSPSTLGRQSWDYQRC
ncbi:hypothetical protein MMC11_002676 [Xylographa trunciseda]|nr:hypothetical protein [Xylographa trunciseda]